MSFATPIDDAAVAAFWQRFLATPAGAGVDGFHEAFRFGDGPALADELLSLVVDGPKRATAGSLAEYDAEGEPPPTVGSHSVVCAGDGTPRAVIRTVDVRVGPLSSVDDAFAWDEGEGDRSRDWWLRAHTEFFTRTHEQLGVPMHADIDVVFERFELVYVEPDGHQPGSSSSSLR